MVIERTWQLVLLSLLTHTLLLLIASSQPINGDDLSVLLSFKSLVNDPRQALSSWGAVGNGTTPPVFCQWTGVACDARRHPGRVTTINLQGFGLVGVISPQLGNLTHLGILDLSDNSLNGDLPSSLGGCPELRAINLSMNSLSGTIPDHLGRLSKLTLFNVSHNSLSGEIPMSLSNLTALTKFIIKRNNFFHGQSLSWLSNLTSLTDLDLEGNGFIGNIPETFGKMHNLIYLSVQDNNFEGPVPLSIFNVSSIEILDLGFNKLSGSLPLNIGLKLPRLKRFNTLANHFEGVIPPSFSNASALESLLLRGNRYHGLIPRDIGIHGNLKVFMLGDNQLQATKPRGWDFLTSLTNCSKLEELDVGQNNLNGVMPVNIANLTKELTWIDLSGNQIIGTIPPDLWKFHKLTYLSLSHNVLTGTLPLNIGRFPRIDSIYLSHNRIDGQIPQSLGNITQLTHLFLSHNFLRGSIPTSLGGLTKLDSMSLSGNILRGQVPQEILRIPSLRCLDLSSNSLSGSIPAQVGHLNSLTKMDLSLNKLSGEIPEAIGSCIQLNFLELQGNLLQGEIPESLNALRSLGNLDLSYNNLSGPIPEFLANFTLLSNLNLSFNILSGPVPNKGIFCNATAVSLLGNRMLCGGPPFLQFPSCPSIVSDQASRHRLRVLIFCIVGALIFFTCCMTTYCFIKARIKPHVIDQDNLFLNEKNERISFAELQAATDLFSPANLIGSGSFGDVYIGYLVLDQNLVAVAVKVLNLGQRGASRSFLAECDALRRIRHRKLVKVITVCSGTDQNGDAFKALVLEFICNGSLNEWLHANTTTNSTISRRLSLMKRLHIALDVAEALEYLHHHIDPPIVHCDIKPSNVLLDDDMVAHVTDLGLAKIMHAEACVEGHGGTGSSSLVIKGTIGYVAPEYGSGCEISMDGDIYSYGVLLLEMFTGRRPTDSFVDGTTSLVNYVKMAYPNNLVEILDANAIYNGNNKDIMDIFIHPIFRLGLACCKESPRERIKMDDVVKELNDIKKACSTHMPVHESRAIN